MWPRFVVQLRFQGHQLDEPPTMLHCRLHLSHTHTKIDWRLLDVGGFGCYSFNKILVEILGLWEIVSVYEHVGVCWLLRVWVVPLRMLCEILSVEVEVARWVHMCAREVCACGVGEQQRQARRGNDWGEESQTDKEWVSLESENVFRMRDWGQVLIMAFPLPARPLIMAVCLTAAGQGGPGLSAEQLLTGTQRSQLRCVYLPW